jgi:hypothetical protein
MPMAAMSAPQTLVQAAINRLSARLGSGLADAAAELAVLAQDAPERMRQEWQLFVEEVELEAERLDQAGGAGATEGGGDQVWEASADPQEQIDQLRAQVARLARRFEGQA